MSGRLTVEAADSVLAFGGYAAAAVLFAGLILWRSRRGVTQPAQRLLLAGFALTACWAWLSAIAPSSVLAGLAESFRNLVWLALLHSLSGGRGQVERQPGLRLVYAAVGLVIGLQLVAGLLGPAMDVEPALAATSALLRMTAAAGLLILVHNLYAQADAPSRHAIGDGDAGADRDLGRRPQPLYLGLSRPRLVAVARRLARPRRGADRAAVRACRRAGRRLANPAVARRHLPVALAAGICGYFATMTILASALGRSGVDWSRPLLAAILAVMVVAGLVLGTSPAARGWARVRLAKHLFEHRYDYRSEWLRFADTVGRSGADAPPVGERLVKAFADIMDSPGGMLLVDRFQRPCRRGRRGGTGPATASSPIALDQLRWSEYRGAAADPRARPDARRDARDIRALPLPAWLAASREAWAGIPLVHSERLIGLVLLAAPAQRRDLDWEDFDLLKTAGRQAAATLAEAHGQQALARAERFDEFNRRFAFILHDIKNLVSQLSLVARNAERHADNPEFRADMVATLKGSVGKMNDLLARLGPAGESRAARIEPVPLRNLVAAAIAAKRGRARHRPRRRRRLGAGRPAAARPGHRPPRPERDRRQPARRAGRDPHGLRRAWRQRRHRRPRRRHGRRIRPQPAVPAVRLDQGRRLRNRRVRGALASSRRWAAG